MAAAGGTPSMHLTAHVLAALAAGHAARVTRPPSPSRPASPSRLPSQVLVPGSVFVQLVVAALAALAGLMATFWQAQLDWKVWGSALMLLGSRASQVYFQVRGRVSKRQAGSRRHVLHLVACLGSPPPAALLACPSAFFFDRLSPTDAAPTFPHRSRQASSERNEIEREMNKMLFERTVATQGAVLHTLTDEMSRWEGRQRTPRVDNSESSTEPAFGRG